jgi:hypothetical protein
MSKWGKSTDNHVLGWLGRIYTYTHLPIYVLLHALCSLQLL